MQVDIFHGHNVRTEVIDSKVWFNNSDVCAVLGSSSPHKVIDRVKEGERKIVPVIDSMGRTQDAWFISERGLIRILQTSRSPLAEPFQDWADERVEQLMRGKTVDAAGLVGEDELIAKAMNILDMRVKRLELENQQMKPKADAFDTFLDAKGSVDVQRAAQLLNRAGIQTGQQRLFEYLDSIKWTSKPFGRSRRAMQRAVEQKLIELKATGYEHPRTGEWVVKDPQIRITPKGLHKLREMMLPPLEIEVAA